jgi:two-component system, OmpR family, sensor kinase
MEERFTAVLERLLAIPLESLQIALIEACDVVATELHADKVDAFLYQVPTDTLVAVGTSTQPLSVKQRQHGLHILPIANGGRVVKVYATGEPYVAGRVDLDPEELLGMRETLAVRSQVGVPLEIGGKRIGVVMVASQKPDFFDDESLRFASVVVRWLGLLVHRAELVERMTKEAAALGRRTAAEELITLVAHDLRNHLGPVDLRLKLMMRRAEREGRIADHADLTHALRSTGRLEAMISDILDVARLDRGVFALETRPLDIVPLVQEVAQTLSTPAHPVVVKPSQEPLMVLADAARVRQCLENLLANATQHSPAGSPVTVLVETERREESELAKIDVLDEGPGVPHELLPHIFDRFVTTKSRTGGLGLGLYVAKRIAELHGGELRVERRTVGTRFSLTVPKLLAV